jgi:hypothetical protein
MRRAHRFIAFLILIAWAACAIYPAWSITAHYKVPNPSSAKLDAGRSFMTNPPHESMPPPWSNDDIEYRAKRAMYQYKDDNTMLQHWSDSREFWGQTNIAWGKTFAPALAATLLLSAFGVLIPKGNKP